MWSLIGERLERAFRTHPEVMRILPAIEDDVIAGRMTPPMATDALFAAFGTPREAGHATT